MPAHEDPPPAPPAPIGFVGRLRGWSGSHPLRNTVVGVALAIATTATVISWLTVAEIAAGPGEDTVFRALELLDSGDDEKAHSIVEKLVQEDKLSQRDYGVALYVLGALKVREAERQWSPDRSRTDYYIASKYLVESRTFGFPEGREPEALYLLGRAYIESRQPDPGIETLREAIQRGVKKKAPAHLLLAEAYFYAPEPMYRRTLAEVEAATADPAITEEQRSSAMLLRSEAFALLGEGEAAREAAAAAGQSAEAPRRELAEGRALVAMLTKAPPAERGALATEATDALQRARRADQLATSISQESDLLKARVTELVGRRDEATQAYNELRRSYGTSESGIAAAFEEGRLRQELGDYAGSLEAFLRGIEAIEDPTTYRSRVLPLSDASRRIEAAHARLIDRERYPDAMQLTESVGRVLGATERLALRARTLWLWGESLLARGAKEGGRGRETLRKGREKLREAGAAYERLAEARFGTRVYLEDLWLAAELNLRGQSYAEAKRLLDAYLRAEPVLRNAQALLRLGEAQLARGERQAAIDTLNECLESYETDASSYRARLLCARAYRTEGRFDEAETLLRHNLTRTALTPAGPEWRDSKFELGQLLSEAGRHLDAIDELVEAVGRYPDDPQARRARYQIALSHREAAREPLQQLREANTVNERELARREADKHLGASLAKFQEVQREITLADSTDDLDRATLRNCFMLAGSVLFEMERYEEARQSFANVSTLYQNEPYMLEALVQIYHCWRRQSDRTKALGVVQQAQQLLERLPPEADFATSTNLSRSDWQRLLSQLATL